MTQKGVIVDLGDRNSGTIKLVGQKEPLFFHADALVGMQFTELHAGDKVTCVITESKKGPYATQIHRA